MKPADFVKLIRKTDTSDLQVPEQGSFVTLYNNEYKMLTKSDAKICILEDCHGNKVSFYKLALLKVLNAQNLNKSEASASASGRKPVFAVGEVRNGRKKVVSPRTGKTMWVDVSEGHAYSEHDSDDKMEHEGVKAQVKQFFNSVGNKVHPGDKMKIMRQLKEVMSLKTQVTNIKDMIAHDKANKTPTPAFQRDRLFNVQDKYKKKFSELRTLLTESAQKRKSEGL